MRRSILLEYIHFVIAQFEEQDTIVEVCGEFDIDVEDALATSQLAHLGQQRRTGEPYIQHPLEVAELVNGFYPGDKVLCAAALMHDALEDATIQGNVSSDAEMAQLIAGSFGDEATGREALRIVRALTHDKTTHAYDEYVVTLLSDISALRIKLADMLHNLRSNPTSTQRLKYANALKALYHFSGSKVPRGIAGAHWKALLTSLKDN
jgi:guanosine-3',5'-bis(diphosphate) 3'-pyrophosphohydrolase